MRFPVAALFCCSAAFAQSPLPVSGEEIAATFNRISQRAARIGPMLAQLHPADWVAKGAPDTYVAQWNSIDEQFRAVQADMSSLARQQTPSLTESMKALFRAQATQETLGSLMGGVRRYQNPALADLVESVAAEANGDIEILERYLLEQAADKERQFAVVDREAQSCRATLSRQPADPARTNRK